MNLFKLGSNSKPPWPVGCCHPLQAGINCISMTEEINRKGVSDKTDLNMCIVSAPAAGATWTIQIHSLIEEKEMVISFPQRSKWLQLNVGSVTDLPMFYSTIHTNEI